MVLWWIGNVILLVAVLPVVIYLLNRVLAALERIRAASDNILTGGVALVGELDGLPEALATPDASRVQDIVYLAQNIPLTRSDPDYYALELGNTVLAGGFYASRLSIDLRKTSGLVYSVDSQLESGRTRSAWLINYACDPDKVTRAAQIAASDAQKMQTALVGDAELNRAKATLLRAMPLEEASINDIARGFAGRRELNLPLDEPTIAARHYIALTPQDVQAAFRKWIRPSDLVRASQGPAPQ